MAVWKTQIPEDAIGNGNISFTDCPFDISRFIGGSNEGEKPRKLLIVHFDGLGQREMWIYGKPQNPALKKASPKNILTNKGRSDVKEFFRRNGIDGSAPVDLEIEELAPGEISVRRA